ncbi:hypothetical protein AB4Z46_33075 [Variovorax sp. M-6]|uniref:hypothetical protein n=1 Tax=Variovorax sp. M-6 TaxID=3233041 RepID=UPI003F97E020
MTKSKEIYVSFGVDVDAVFGWLGSVDWGRPGAGSDGLGHVAVPAVRRVDVAGAACGA